MTRTARLLAAFLVLSAGTLNAQTVPRRAGPVVQSAGAVLPVPDPDIPTPTDRVFRAVFEVVESAGSPDQINPSFNTAARFLNMHAQAGVPPERLQVALVVHGPAGKDLLGDGLYRTRFGVSNPNLRLLDELAGAGVRIILCGQTAASRDLPRDALAPPVEVALSAMTAFVLLQDQGYRLIPF